MIRNPAIEDASVDTAHAASDAHVAEITALIRAVASQEPLPGYLVEQVGWGGPTATQPESETALLGNDLAGPKGLALLEVWRGAHYEALVLALAPTPDPRVVPIDAQVLASHFAPGVLAVWIDESECAKEAKSANSAQKQPNTRIAVIVCAGAGHVGR